MRSVGAQTTGKIHRIGLVRAGGLFTDSDPFIAGLSGAFAKRGYSVGVNLVFESRAAQGKLDLLPQQIEELMASHVDLLITSSYPAALAAKEHATVPIVVTNSGDPVATHLVASLARPGGNMTGVSEIATELSAKRL